MLIGCPKGQCVLIDFLLLVTFFAFSGLRWYNSMHICLNIDRDEFTKLKNN